MLLLFVVSSLGLCLPDIPSFYSWNACGLHVLYCSDYPHLFCLGPITITVSPVSFDLIVLYIILRTMACAYKGKAIPVTSLEGTGLWDVEAPTYSIQSAHRWRWGCQPYAPAALCPQEDSGYSFLFHSAAGRIRWIEKSNDLIGNQTRDLPACSIVPQLRYRPVRCL
jgi:hypothetical protein